MHRQPQVKEGRLRDLHRYRLRTAIATTATSSRPRRNRVADRAPERPSRLGPDAGRSGRRRRAGTWSLAAPSCGVDTAPPPPLDPLDAAAQELAELVDVLELVRITAQARPGLQRRE